MVEVLGNRLKKLGMVLFGVESQKLDKEETKRERGVGYKKRRGRGAKKRRFLLKRSRVFYFYCNFVRHSMEGIRILST